MGHNDAQVASSPKEAEKKGLIDGATPMHNSEAEVKIEISRYVDDAFPGWVECILVDALGVEHMFVEKVPVVTKVHLDAGISYPQPGVIACVVLERSERDDGRQLIHIDTQKPWGVESTAGRSQFEVFPEQLRETHSD